MIPRRWGPEGVTWRSILWERWLNGYLAQRAPSLFLACSFRRCLILCCAILKDFPVGPGTHWARYPLSRRRFARALAEGVSGAGNLSPPPNSSRQAIRCFPVLLLSCLCILCFHAWKTERPWLLKMMISIWGGTKKRPAIFWFSDLGKSWSRGWG